MLMKNIKTIFNLMNIYFFYKQIKCLLLLKFEFKGLKLAIFSKKINLKLIEKIVMQIIDINKF